MDDNSWLNFIEALNVFFPNRVPATPTSSDDLWKCVGQQEVAEWVRRWVNENIMTGGIA